MPHPTLEVADIFRRYGEAWRARNVAHLSRGQRRVMTAIEICRILDYKPDAGTNKPIAQLTIYALALTRLVPGLRLFDIKCAWFNEHEYCEFFPRTLFAR